LCGPLSKSAVTGDVVARLETGSNGSRLSGEKDVTSDRRRTWSDAVLPDSGSDVTEVTVAEVLRNTGNDVAVVWADSEALRSVPRVTEGETVRPDAGDFEARNDVAEGGSDVKDSSLDSEAETCRSDVKDDWGNVEAEISL